MTNDHIFVNSSLEVKAVASLQEQIDKELLLKDSTKTIAELLQTNNEEENSAKEKQKDPNIPQD